MLRRLGLLYAALLVMAVTRARWGVMGEALTAGALIVVAGTAGVLVWRRDRELRRRVAELPLQEQLEALEEDPDVRDAAAGVVFGNERRDWLWQVTRIAGPCLAVFYLPLLYTLVARPDPNGVVVIGLGVVGVVIWRQWARRYIGHYRCPGCGAFIPAVSLRPVRFVCLSCSTTWRL